MNDYNSKKCIAGQPPQNAARASARVEGGFEARHSPDEKRKAATMIRERPKRQTAIVIESAAESRTSGPANEIPSRESASTQYGFADIQKKRAGALAPALFQDNLSLLSAI